MDNQTRVKPPAASPFFSLFRSQTGYLILVIITVTIIATIMNPRSSTLTPAFSSATASMLPLRGDTLKENLIPLDVSKKL